jgi:hypothetical protein
MTERLWDCVGARSKGGSDFVTAALACVSEQMTGAAPLYEPGDRTDTRHGFKHRHDLALPTSGKRVGPAAPTAFVCRDGNRGSASIRYAVAIKNRAFAAATQGHGTDQTNLSGGRPTRIRR